ncbi:MAG: response regulator transcription factor [Clostridiales bacterium]|nr:response regulator transcription factor [Clostridiales bacterium]
MAIRIVIADDDALIRDSLVIFFEMDERFEVIGIAKNGQEALELCLSKEVDVAVLDIRMPTLNGVDATGKIVSNTQTRVLILTTFDDDDDIKNVFLNGASGYLLKNSPPDEIKNAVVTVHGGNNVIQDVVMDQLRNPHKNLEEKLKDLTTREKDVVELISKGLTNQEIAETLFITEGTVKNLVSQILSKLTLKHRTQIAIYYLE